MRLASVVLLSGLVVSAGALTTSAQNQLPPDAPRPIEAASSLWAEELTSMEIRDAIRAGTTTIIVATGGVEQNGPYVAGGKHNQTGMEKVADALNRKWSGERARPGQPQDRPSDWRNGIHDDLYYEAQVAVQDPALIRMNQRLKAGLFSLHGVELAPINRTIEIGQKLAAHRAGITAKAFLASQRRLRRKG